MEKSIYRYILKYTARDQVAIILITLLSMPLVYYSLEIPKLIINKALGGNDVPSEILGVDINQIEYLLLLSFSYLGLVLIHGGIKYVINVYRGVLGERMLRRFRYMLYYRILRFPLVHFKRVSGSEIIPMITAETRPLGGFIGDSIALPVFQGGLLITYLFFIFKQDLWLGLAAIALYPPQMMIIPKLQRRVNELAKQRTLHARKLADHIGESVAGISDIHGHHTSAYERAKISDRLGIMFRIRYDIYKRKFFIKFLNNFVAVLTPFFFYSIGGYLVLQGKISLGALVAVLAAYKDVSPPWKELLKFYQITQDIKVKYAQIIEQFQPSNMFDTVLMDKETETNTTFSDSITTNNLSYAEGDKNRTINAISTQLVIKQHTAIMGKSSHDSHDFAQLLARLIIPVSGEILIDEHHTRNLPEAVLGRRIAYCGTDSYVFNSTILDNLQYSLKHHPIAKWDEKMINSPDRDKDIKDALASANSSDDPKANWVDFKASGAEDEQAYQRLCTDILKLVELEEDVFGIGLNQSIDVKQHPRWVDQILQIRKAIASEVNSEQSIALVELFDKDQYNNNMSVAENILFGAPTSDNFALDVLPSNTQVNAFLKDQGLDQKFVAVGHQLAELMLDLFSDVAGDSDLFEQFSFIKAEDFPEYQRIIDSVKKQGLDSLEAKDKQCLIALTYQLTPARHRLGLINDEIKPKVLRVRKLLRAALGEDNPDITFFDINHFNPAVSIQDNIIFGRIAYGVARAEGNICLMIEATVEQLQLREIIIEAGLGYIVGPAGARLSQAQRQKLILARCLLKNPDILIVNNALSSLNPESLQRVLDNVMAFRTDKNLVWSLNQKSLQSRFDSILTIESGKLVSHESPKLH